ncbi:peptide MFS transporter [Corynebacterium auriscanis]|uniref:peptide MFS transporter n=1 Tax=Corynebacterium auriscanis TaxID=99807 RepID=UPI003CF62C23
MTTIEHRTTQSVPPALPAIAGVEMWERFSFYGMQAILTYYLYDQAQGLALEQSHATALVGAYGALLYLFTFAGGWVADRVLGAERTLLTGAGLLIAGHLSLSLIPGFPGLFAGLLPLALGSGLLKTAAITILGAAFPPKAGARDGAFQIFYLGINIGALFGPMLTGWLALARGYHVGFGAAALLMAIGCAMYLALRSRMLSNLDSARRALVTQPANPLAPRRLVLVSVFAAVAVAAGIWSITTGVITPNRMAFGLLIATVTVAVGLFVVMLTSSQVNADERTRVVGFIPLFVASTMYWALQAQTYGVLAVYSDQRLDRTIGSFEVPAAWTQSLNPFYILVFTLPIAGVLATRAMPGRNRLMGGGLALAGAGILSLLPFAHSASVPFLALAVCILLMSLGELFIGPIGMAATAAHAPTAFATRFSALFFLSLAIGTSLAGSLSTFYSAETELAYLVVVGLVPIATGLAIALKKPRTWVPGYKTV